MGVYMADTDWTAALESKRMRLDVDVGAAKVDKTLCVIVSFHESLGKAESR